MAPVQRMNYFDQQFLRAADFTTEQEYHRESRRRPLRALGLVGIADAFELSAAGLVLTIGPGYGIDADGREIVLVDARRLDLAAAPIDAPLWVTIRYAERATEPSDETGVLGDTRVNEEPTIEATPVVPADPTRTLVLGGVIRRAAGIGVQSEAPALLSVTAGRLAVGRAPSSRAVEAVGDIGWGSNEIQNVLSDEFGILLGDGRRITFAGDEAAGLFHESDQRLRVRADPLVLPSQLEVDDGQPARILLSNDAGSGIYWGSDEAMISRGSGSTEIHAADVLTLMGSGGRIELSSPDITLSFNNGASFTFGRDGTVSATVKNFRIDHPSDPDRELVHSTLEGPEVAVVYRGQAALVGNAAVVELPDYFERLTRPENRTVLLTPIISPDGRVALLGASEVRDGRFSVQAADAADAGARFYWEVKAVRADVAPLEVEPLRSSATGVPEGRRALAPS